MYCELNSTGCDFTNQNIYPCHLVLTIIFIMYSMHDLNHCVKLRQRHF